MTRPTPLHISPQTRQKRLWFLGCPLDALSMRETLALIEAAMREKKALRQGVVNVAKLVTMQRDEALYRDVTASDIINIDGAGVVFGCRLLGHNVPQRVTGIDVMQNVLTLCAQQGFKPYILGAMPEVLAKAKANIMATHPPLQFAGAQDGYYDQSRETEVINAINASGADCLFIAMPSPHKERIMAQYRGTLQVPFIMGVGGAVDVLAGHVRRAPLWMQHAGLEWFFRLLQEPRRLFKRYWTTNWRYGFLVLQALLGYYQPPAFAQQPQNDSTS